MVQANETVAEWLKARDLPALYRCHGAPEEEYVKSIEATACELGQYVAFSRPVSPVAFRAFYQQIERSRDLPALRDLLAGALGSAEYTTENYGHFGLGSACYVHFTSPLRRYADLLVHRVIKRHLRGASTRKMFDVLERMEAHISDISTRADKAEREARQALVLREIETKQVRRTTGTIRGISETKIRIEAVELGGVGGYIMVRKLGGWRFDERRHEGVRNGKILKVGAKVDVEATKIDALRGSLEFAFHGGGRAEAKTPGRGERGGKRTRRRR
jgi:ribonuclease R